MSHALLVGQPARAQPAGPVAQESPRRPDAAFAPRTRRANCRGCAARAFPGADAQGHLGAGSEGGVSSLKRMSSRQTLALLHQFESRNVTHIESNGSWPIVWSRAR